MVDIVERLRGPLGNSDEDCYEAADYIEKLRADIDRMASLAIDNAKDTKRLREALQNIASKNPFHNQCLPAGDTNYYGKLIAEMVVIANAALKESSYES